MADAARSSTKATSRSTGRILLIETAPDKVAPLRQKIRRQGLDLEVGHDLKEACPALSAGSHPLVVVGRGLDRLELGRIPTELEDGPSPLNWPALDRIYAAKDTKELLACTSVAASEVMQSEQAFALLCHRGTGQPDPASLQTTPSDSPDLRLTLRAGLGILTEVDSAEADSSRDAERGAVRPGSHLWMVPMIHCSRLEGLVGVVSQGVAEPFTTRLGALRILSLGAAPLVAAWRDVQQLGRTRDELEAALQIKLHLMSNVCHEFRSILAAAQGYVKRILDGRDGAINEAQRDHLKVALKNSDKILDLVSYSLPFTAEQQLRVETFDLREAWQRALKRIRGRASALSITIKEQIDSEAYTVTGDSEKLTTVFEILLTNIIACAPNGCEVTAQFARGAQKEVTVRLLAAGPGFPLPAVDGIFDHRVAPEANPKEGRRIPRLSFIHDIIWLHGGRMAVTNNSGEGTVFVFTLPPPSPRGDESNAGQHGMSG